MPSQPSARFRYIDLLRGLSALAVLIYHYRAFFVAAPDTWPPLVGLPLQDWLWPVYQYGRLAVQTFWVISGFVFAVTYGQLTQKLSIFQFFIYRLARLYPLHLSTLIFVACIQILSFRLTGNYQIYGSNTALDFIAQIFLASNWLSAYRFTFNGPIWSVSIEVLIYVVFAVYFKFFKPELRSAIAIACIFFTFALLTGKPIAQCGALFFTGVGLGLMMKISTLRLGLMGSAGLMATVALCATGDQVYVTGALSYLAGPSIVALLACFELRLPVLSSRLWWIGEITYAVYLIHMPLIMVWRLAIGDRLVLHTPMGLLAFVVFVVLISVIIHRCLELPMQRFIRSVVPRVQVLRLSAAKFDRTRDPGP